MTGLWHRLRIRRMDFAGRPILTNRRRRLERSPDEGFGLLALLRRAGAL
jgi:hypothetical protein